MDKLAFFDLIFEQHNPKVSKDYANADENKHRPGVTSDSTVADEFTSFFYRHNLVPLFTEEHRTQPIQVALIDAQSVIKEGGKANRLLKDFANLLSMGTDNKAFNRATFKILHESRTWQGFLKKIEEHLVYVDYIDEGHKFNAWNIVYYDKDKTNYAAGSASRKGG